MRYVLDANIALKWFLSEPGIPNCITSQPVIPFCASIRQKEERESNGQA